MHNQPTISVVIPSYNYGRFVRDAIESAMAQTHRPLEVIVVDDGSTDDTANLLRPFSGNIRYIFQKNSGLSAARNTGIRAASGEWVAFLDADDVWFQDKLALQMACASQYEDVCVIGAIEGGSARSAGARSFPALSINNNSELFTRVATVDLLGGMPFGASSVVARRDSLIKAGLFDETRRSVEDREMWLKLSLIGGAARVNKALWTYRIHPEQMNSNPQRMCENYARVLDSFFECHPEQSRHRAFAYAYYCYDSAMAYHDGRKNLQALAYLLKSFALHPSPLPQQSGEKRFNRFAVLFKCVFGAWLLSRLAGVFRLFMGRDRGVKTRRTART